jgi:hypothetical protein
MTYYAWIHYGLQKVEALNKQLLKRNGKIQRTLTRASEVLQEVKR